MAVLLTYGTQETATTPLAAPLDIIDYSAAPQVIRQFPLGEYWSRTDGFLPRLARAIGRFLSRLRRRRDAFDRQIDPRTADELLDERERERGVVPIEGQTIDERRAVVLAKMRANGGVNVEYYTGLCVSAGYLDAVVTAAADPFTTISLCDDFLQNGLWMITMQVTATSLGAANDQALQDLINGQLLAGFYAIYTFT